MIRGSWDDTGILKGKQTMSDTDPIAVENTDDAVVAHRGVLIVDDNEQNLELLHAYLDDLGGPVRVVDDGIKAIESVKSDPPGII